MGGNQACKTIQERKEKTKAERRARKISTPAGQTHSKSRGHGVQFFNGSNLECTLFRPQPRVCVGFGHGLCTYLPVVQGKEVVLKLVVCESSY